MEAPPSLPNSTTEENPVDTSNGDVASNGDVLSPGAAAILGNLPRRPSAGLNQPLGPRFILRNNPDAPNQTVTKRGTDEIREHLRHLGPSNLASRPRQTRYQNVKIKAPGVSPTRSGVTDSDSGRRFSTEQQRRSSELISIHTGTDAPTTTPAGSDSRDGIRAVRQGYGTIDRVLEPRVVDSSSKAAQSDIRIDATKLLIPTEHEQRLYSPASTPSRTPNRSKPSSVHSYETRPIGHQKGPSRISGPVHGPARSGSITEQVIDVNGIRKVVLQTTSSSSASSDTERMAGRSPKSLLSPHGLSHEEAVESEHTDEASTSVTKKRRRRRKNRKHDGHDNERKPLLPK